MIYYCYETGDVIPPGMKSRARVATMPAIKMRKIMAKLATPQNETPLSSSSLLVSALGGLSDASLSASVLFSILPSGGGEFICTGTIVFDLFLIPLVLLLVLNDERVDEK